MSGRKNAIAFNEIIDYGNYVNCNFRIDTPGSKKILNI